jgi:hypothetical protein
MCSNRLTPNFSDFRSFFLFRAFIIDRAMSSKAKVQTLTQSSKAGPSGTLIKLEFRFLHFYEQNCSVFSVANSLDRAFDSIRIIGCNSVSFAVETCFFGALYHNISLLICDFASFDSSPSFSVQPQTLNFLSSLILVAFAADDVAKVESSNKFLVATIKRIRALKKKLRHIDDLKKSGKALDEQALASVASEQLLLV